MVEIDVLFELGSKFVDVMQKIVSFFLNTRFEVRSFVGSLRELGWIPASWEDKLPLFSFLPDAAVTEYSLVEYLLGPGLVALVGLILLKWFLDMFF